MDASGQPMIEVVCLGRVADGDGEHEAGERIWIPSDEFDALKSLGVVEAVDQEPAGDSDEEAAGSDGVPTLQDRVAAKDAKIDDQALRVEELKQQFDDAADRSEEKAVLKRQLSAARGKLTRMRRERDELAGTGV